MNKRFDRDTEFRGRESSRDEWRGREDVRGRGEEDRWGQDRFRGEYGRGQEAGEYGRELGRGSRDTWRESEMGREREYEPGMGEGRWSQGRDEGRWSQGWRPFQYGQYGQQRFYGQSQGYGRGMYGEPQYGQQAGMGGYGMPEREWGGGYGYGGQSREYGPAQYGYGSSQGEQPFGQRMREAAGELEGGVRGAIKKFLGKGPKGYKRSDERIKDDVCDQLSEGYIDASDIEVSVKDGEVTLTGTVPDRRSKHIAEQMIEHLGGVQDVHNQLRVKREIEVGEGASMSSSDVMGRKSESTGRRNAVTT